MTHEERSWRPDATGAVDEDELDSSVTVQREKRQVRWLPTASLCVLYVGEFAMSMLRLHLERGWFRPTPESRTLPKQMGVVAPLRVVKRCLRRTTRPVEKEMD